MASDPNKTVARSWTFKSGSNPDKTHETLQYASGEVSCDCKGWTLKLDHNGHRSCKHTRLIHQGLADKQAIAMIDYTKNDPSLKRVFEENVKALDTLGTGKRRLAI